MKFSNKLVSIPLALSFIVVAGSGIVLEFFFKNHELIEIHIWVGMLMIALGFFHVLNNKIPMLHYLKDKKITSLFILLFTAFSFAFLLPTHQEKKGFNPKVMTNVLAAGKFETVSAVFNIPSEEVLKAMETRGIRIDSKDEVLDDIAKKNKVNVEEVISVFISKR